MKKQKKSLVVMSLAVILVAALLIGGTLSYFTDEADITNTLTIGDIDVDIDEEEWDDDDDGKDMMPGQVWVKDPLITAEKGDMYFRVKMTVYNLKADGTPGAVITDTDRLALILKTLYYDTNYKHETEQPNLKTDQKYSTDQLAALVTANKIYSPVNLVDFAAATSTETGVYYFNYKSLFEEGDEVYFMTNVVTPSDWETEEMEKLGNYAVTFKVEAIQAEGFSTYTEALSALAAQIAANQTP